MNDPKAAPKYESILLRILWMLVFALVWQVAQFLLGALVVVRASTAEKDVSVLRFWLAADARWLAAG